MSSTLLANAPCLGCGRRTRLAYDATNSKAVHAFAVCPSCMPAARRAVPRGAHVRRYRFALLRVVAVASVAFVVVAAADAALLVVGVVR